ncbi:MAG: endonuclease/exonuclease/phosphatase family protein [bacterium]
MPDSSPPPARLLDRQVNPRGIAWIVGLLITYAALFLPISRIIRHDWPLENFTVFRVQYFWLFTLVALVCLIARQRIPAALFALVAIWQGATFIPLYFGGPPHPLPPKQLRLFSSNVLYENKQYAQLFEAVKEADPDIVLLAEFDNDWAAEIAPLQAEYPYSQMKPLGGAFGIACFSRIPLDTLTIEHSDQGDAPYIRASLTIEGQPLTIYGVHLKPPIDQTYLRERNAELNELAPLISARTTPTLLIGDLNLTSDSGVFGRFLKQTGLHDSRAGYGIQASWPKWVPLAKIAIDHCLISPEIVIVDRHLGPDIGSDHRPLIVDLAISSP